MPIYYPDILQQVTPDRKFSYTEKDVMLYALGIGFGHDPMNEDELPFVCEEGLRPFPTAVTVLSNADRISALEPVVPAGLRVSSFDYPLLLHGAQRITMHRPLPPRGEFTLGTRVISAIDKGRDVGAIVTHESVWRDREDIPIATLVSTAFARGDGGFGGPAGGLPNPHIVPSRQPDVVIDIPTQPSQALLYRLNGDKNPLHWSPVAARRAGFSRPILHGLCTYGIALRAIVSELLQYDESCVRTHAVRFSSPTYPGELLRMHAWLEGEMISFEVKSVSREVVVISNGETLVGGAPRW